ncbi:MAG TPA: sigma-70 family RNA polymerase sigma factor [Polyangia bacterium]|nr:sigma-70 family RNA polymerase sigma factor [Polyangia bacterium]HVZ89189.1 sigma-70 family RNA polymerase sigma factor [Polyangia bacterium]
MLPEKRRVGGDDQLRPSDVVRVYTEHSDDVSKTIRRIAGRSSGSAECDDLVQTTFLLFHRAVRAGKVDRSLNIGGYLSTIARNVARDWIVGRSREVLVAAIPEETTEAAGEAANDVDVGVVRTYLAALSPELRDFYVLRFEKELPLLQIARLLKTSRQRVRTLELRLLGEGRKTLLFPERRDHGALSCC